MNRREFFKAAVALPLAQSALSNSVFAQAPWPTRNITMIVPFPAGGQADLAARPVALALEKILGKPVIVDNRAGGGGGSVGNAADRKSTRLNSSHQKSSYAVFCLKKKKSQEVRHRQRLPGGIGRASCRERV